MEKFEETCAQNKRIFPNDGDCNMSANVYVCVCASSDDCKK